MGPHSVEKASGYLGFLGQGDASDGGNNDGNDHQHEPTDFATRNHEETPVENLPSQLPLRCIPYTKVTVLPIGDIPFPTRVMPFGCY
ncbi:MAG TPA: hypothetical protein VGU25_06625 [Acidobacteriaceae bacterium]|nr:hypothetical protein [Acidobacteriaceae bacterium]